MSSRKSQRLRLSEVRAAFRLVGECREFGADVDAWRVHLASRIGGLVGAQVVVAGEVMAPADGETPGEVLHAVSHGWTSARARAIHLAYLASGEYKQTDVYRKMQRLATRISTCTRDQAIDDREWYGSAHFNEVLRPCEVDDFMISEWDLPGGRQNLIGIHRARGGRTFRTAERRLIRLVHEELGRHLGSSLFTLADPNPRDLAPRLRHVLSCLLEGDAEKRVALRLGISTTTVHEYVKAIYRHFRVGSRPELLAYFLRRSGLRSPDRT